MWSAEQMIDRLVSKSGIKNDHPTLKSIREAAVSGDEVKWAAVVDIVRKLETDTKPHLNVLKRNKKAPQVCGAYCSVCRRAAPGGPYQRAGKMLLHAVVDQVARQVGKDRITAEAASVRVTVSCQQTTRMLCGSCTRALTNFPCSLYLQLINPSRSSIALVSGSLWPPGM